jgi:hypothetical protein
LLLNCWFSYPLPTLATYWRQLYPAKARTGRFNRAYSETDVLLIPVTYFCCFVFFLTTILSNLLFNYKTLKFVKGILPIPFEMFTEKIICYRRHASVHTSNKAGLTLRWVETCFYTEIIPLLLGLYSKLLVYVIRIIQWWPKNENLEHVISLSTHITTIAQWYYSHYIGL